MRALMEELLGLAEAASMRKAWAWMLKTFPNSVSTVAIRLSEVGGWQYSPRTFFLQLMESG